MMKDQYIIGDSRKLLDIARKNKLEKPSSIITSPPYFNIKNYDNNESQLGFKQSYHQFLIELCEIIHQAYKLAKKNATLWLIVDTFKINGKTFTLPFDIVSKINELYNENSWVLKDIIIWNKKKNIPWHFKGKFKNEFEYILFFSKGDNYRFSIDELREVGDYKSWWKSYPERYNTKGKPPSNIWEFNPPIRGWGNGYQNHLCPFPFQLIERIISVSSKKGDAILDPFSGSGSVIALANEMNRNGFGLDISSNYKQLYENEVKIGAKKYWAARKKEIEKNQYEIKKFSKALKNLRKIKSCSFVASELNNEHLSFVLINKRQAKIYIISKTHIKNNIEKIVLEKNVKSKFKNDIEIIPTTVDKFLTSLNGTKEIFSYSKDKIYSYNSKLSPSEIFNSTNQDLIFANIKLDL